MFYRYCSPIYSIGIRSIQMIWLITWVYSQFSVIIYIMHICQPIIVIFTYTSVMSSLCKRWISPNWLFWMVRICIWLDPGRVESRSRGTGDGATWTWGGEKGSCCRCFKWVSIGKGSIVLRWSGKPMLQNEAKVIWNYDLFVLYISCIMDLISEDEIRDLISRVISLVDDIEY